LILAIMGSGHPLQIDGIGGGSPQTSKVAIISQSTHPDADIDYLFAQVAIIERIVDTAPNCGNILCAVVLKGHRQAVVFPLPSALHSPLQL